MTFHRSRINFSVQYVKFRNLIPSDHFISIFHFITQYRILKCYDKILIKDKAVPKRKTPHSYILHTKNTAS